MALVEAKFSAHMTELLGVINANSDFVCVKRRQVNVLKEQEFPMLSVWSDRSGNSGTPASDGQIEEESTYIILVAAVLGEDQDQDVELGKLIKVVIDAVQTYVTPEKGRFIAGDWEGDNNANEGDGATVWAAMPVSVRFARNPGEY